MRDEHQIGHEGSWCACGNQTQNETGTETETPSGSMSQAVARDIMCKSLEAPGHENRMQILALLAPSASHAEAKTEKQACGERGRGRDRNMQIDSHAVRLHS